MNLARRFLSLLAARRSIEDPSVPLDQYDNGLWDGLGAGPSSSGVAINRETALTYSPVWRAVNLISRDVGKLPLVVYERNGEEGKDRAVDHSAYLLLLRKPNAEMTSFVFRQTITAHALLEGNGYAYIDRAGDASPVGLVPLLPGSCYPVRVAGQLWYLVTVNGVQRRILPENILHIKGLSVDGLVGYRLYKKAKNSLGLGIASEEFAARYFRNGAEPSAVIEHPGKLGDKAADNLRKSWNKMHQGLENAHKVAILEEGMKLNSFGNNARNSQLIETRSFGIVETANWFGLPPHKLGDRTRSGYASLEQENQAYLDDALDPWLVCWEEECHDKLLTEQQKQNDTHIVQFNRQMLVRANLAARAAFYQSALSAGWMNRDEVRGMENMNPIPDGDGEKFLVALNMGPAGGVDPDAGKEDPPPEDNPDEKSKQDALRAVVFDAAKRMARRLATHAAKYAGTGAEWARSHRDVIASALSPGILACGLTTAAAAADWMIARAKEMPIVEIESSLPDELVAFVFGE